jgi:hypothetical protein
MREPGEAMHGVGLAEKRDAAIAVRGARAAPGETSGIGLAFGMAGEALARKMAPVRALRRIVGHWYEGFGRCRVLHGRRGRFVEDDDEPTLHERVGDVAGYMEFLSARELCECARAFVVLAGEDAVVARFEHTDTHGFRI